MKSDKKKNNLLVTILIFLQKFTEQVPHDFIFLPVDSTKPDQNSKVPTEDAERAIQQASGEFIPLHFRHLNEVFKLAI